MNKAFKRILENKKRERNRLATLPFVEKIKVLEQLRDREATILASRNKPLDADLAARVSLVREKQQAAYDSTNKKEGQCAE